jgi:bifunctional DNA-binding transcriptional regulator/antitoxin component of YhaV-PrlF toxin-antitoxin module
MVHTSKLSAKGIPSEMRDSLVLGTGDLVGYEIRGEEVVLKRVDDEAFRHL